MGEGEGERESAEAVSAELRLSAPNLHAHARKRVVKKHCNSSQLCCQSQEDKIVKFLGKQSISLQIISYLFLIFTYHSGRIE